MSAVHNYILALPIGEDEAVAGLNEDLAGAKNIHNHGRPFFVAVNDAAGGYKVFEARCYLFAGNFVSPVDLAPFILSQPWQLPDDFLMLYMAPESDRFTPLRLDDVNIIMAGADLGRRISDYIDAGGMRLIGRDVK